MTTKEFKQLKRGQAVKNKYDFEGNGISFIEEIRGARAWVVSKNWNGYKWCIAADITRADNKWDLSEEELDQMISEDPVIQAG